MSTARVLFLGHGADELLGGMFIRNNVALLLLVYWLFVALQTPL